MIKKLTIHNFKAIGNLTVEFKPFTILIGENSCGKSTILQALDFLCSITSRDIDEYLKDHDWDFNEIKSQFAETEKAISFAAEFNLNDEMLLWEISINNINDKWIIQESIMSTITNKCYLSFGNEQADIPTNLSGMNVKSSALKMLDTARSNRSNLKEVKYDIVLIMLKKWLISSSSFELLSPDKMRSKVSRGKVGNIGMGGEKLSAFIHEMPSARRNELNKMVSEFIGYEIKLTTTTRGRPGWVDMYLEETWGLSPVRIKKLYISDGLLRIIAFSAILVNLESKKAGQLSPSSDSRTAMGFVLLDEIEDGVHPYLAEKLITRFARVATESKSQIIVTSHSPTMINFADPSSIYFMWRDTDGRIHAKPFFQTEQMTALLEFLNPGEVWLNYSKDEIISNLASNQEDIT